MKIAINIEIGGFSVSKEIAHYMAEKGYESAIQDIDFHIRRTKELMESTNFNEIDIDNLCGYGYFYERDNPLLIEAIEKFNNTPHLMIVEVPDDIKWYIDTSDNGIEWVAEKHRTWGP